MHMVAARLGCQSAMVGTGWANSCPGLSAVKDWFLFVYAHRSRTIEVQIEY